MRATVRKGRAVLQATNLCRNVFRSSIGSLASLCLYAFLKGQLRYRAAGKKDLNSAWRCFPIFRGVRKASPAHMADQIAGAAIIATTAPLPGVVMTAPLASLGVGASARIVVVAVVTVTVAVTVVVAVLVTVVVAVLAVLVIVTVVVEIVTLVVEGCTPCI